MAPPKTHQLHEASLHEQTGQTSRPDKRARGKEAQKRFREKNKAKFGDIEKEVLAMSDQLGSLEAQKIELKAQISRLQAATPRQWPSPPCLPDIDKVEPPFMPSVSFANFNLEGKGGIILRAIYPQPRRLTREQAEGLSLEDIRGMLEEYVLRGGQLLTQHPMDVLLDTNTKPGAELKELQTERRGLCFSLAALQPYKMLLLQELGFNRGTLAPPANATKDYSAILKRLELTPCQKQALHDAGKAYVSRVHDLLSEREGLKGRLDGMSLGPAAHGGVSQLDALAYAEVVRKIRDNFDATYVQKGILWMTFLYRLESITYVQEAKWWLEAHPSFPDPEMLYYGLVREMEAQDSKEERAVPATQVKTLEDSQEPYVELVAKMMDAFENFGLSRMVKKWEGSLAGISRQ